MNYIGGVEHLDMSLTQAWIIGAMGWVLFTLDLQEVMRDYDES